MHIVSSIAAWLMVPFLSLALLLGFHAGAASSAPASGVEIGFEPPAHPQEPVATSSGSTIHSHPTAPPTEPTSTPAAGPIELDTVAPASAAVGTAITLRGSGFTASNTVLLGGNVVAKDAHLSSFSNGHQEITFVLPSSAGPDCKAGEMCPMYMMLVSPGTYQISVENENGRSNSVSFTVAGTPLTSEAR